MKALIIGLFCLALSFGEGFCQEKVLIVTRDSSPFLNILPVSKLHSALSAYYEGEIITYKGNLPDSLDQYDAIFTDLRIFSGDDSLFIAQELEKLTDFLLAKGKLYIEIRSETIYRWDYEDSIYSEYPLFRQLIGSIDFGPTAASEYLNQIRGVTGHFTEGMYYEHKDDWRYYGYLGVGGQDLNVVLETNGLTKLAWTHEGQNRQVVWHDPVIDDHYVEFLGRVICNYFGLCEPLAVSEPSKLAKEFSIAYDLLSNKLLIENADGYSTLAIYNTLGVKLFERNIFERTIEFPNELPAGNYFVVASGVGRVSSKGIIVWK